MKAGVGWIIAGVALLVAGVAVTMLSQHVVLYGAMIVGLIWIGRGILRLVQASKTDVPPRPHE